LRPFVKFRDDSWQGGEGRKLYRVGRIPPSMTTQGERHESRFGRLGQEYGPITFDQAQLKADPTLEWVTPGHPLFEALREDVLDQAQADFRRGAIFFELQRSMPARLDLFSATMSDGRKHVLERRIMVVETRLDATQIVRQPTLFLDLVPAPEGTSAPTGVGLPDTDSAVQVLTEQDLQVLLGDLQATRAHEIDRVAEHTAISLNALIHRQSMRMAELFAQQDASTENPLVAANLKQTSDRIELLNARLERRQAELAQERYVTISQVRHLAQAWVLPHPERASALLAPLISDVDVERVAVREVTRTLTAAGWAIESVETQNRGFDLIARLREPHPPNTARAVRYIEVKGRSALGDVALTNNEYKTAERLGEDYWLYVVYHCATQPEVHAVRDPTRLPWAEVMQVAHYRVGVRQILAQQES